MKFDSPEWRHERDILLLGWMQGDHHARAFILQIAEIAEVWDDLVDGDPVPQYRLNGAFITAIFDLSGNPFFRKHSDYLRPILLAGINAWLDSTKMEKATDSWSRTWAYALRDWYMELVPACAFLVGGFDHMTVVSMAARAFFQKESLQEYLDGLDP